MADFPFSHPRPAWLPDWRDEAAYAGHGNDLQAWAWEFLRRNPEYQADYARWAALPDTEMAEDGQPVWSCKLSIVSGDWTDMKYFHAEPPALPGETVGQYYNRTGEAFPPLLNRHMCEKWGVAMPFPDPAAANVPELWEELDIIPPYRMHSFPPEADVGPRSRSFYGWEERHFYAPAWDEENDCDVFVYGVDIRFDIDAQLKTIAAVLGEIKRERMAGTPEDSLQTPLRPVTFSTPQAARLLGILRALDCAWAEGAEAWRQLAVNKVYQGQEKPVPRGNKAAMADEWERFAEAGRKWADRALDDARQLVVRGYKMLLIRDAFLLQSGRLADPGKTTKSRKKPARNRKKSGD